MSKDAYTVVREPLLSEKGSELGEKQNQYFFKVALGANKIEIKQAIERLYKVKVANVNTMRMPGKRKQYRRKVEDLRRYWRERLHGPAAEESPSV